MLRRKSHPSKHSDAVEVWGNVQLLNSSCVPV